MIGCIIAVQKGEFCFHPGHIPEHQNLFGHTGLETVQGKFTLVIVGIGGDAEVISINGLHIFGIHTDGTFGTGTAEAYIAEPFSAANLHNGRPVGIRAELLTAMNDPTEIPVMLGEMGTVGVGMAILVTVTWIAVTIIADVAAKRQSASTKEGA